MLFLFKKIVTPFFLPLPLGLLISFLGLFLLWFTKRQRTGKVLVTVGMCTVALLSYGPISGALLAPLEHQFEPFKTENYARNLLPNKGDSIKYVVVLGGGHSDDPEVPVTSRLSDPALKRLLEGIRIFRENPGSKLVLSGRGAFSHLPEATVMAEVAAFIGVDGDDVILEPESDDTKDQARLIRFIVGKDRFVLVTSALHLPRAMALFRKMGMDPIPGPAEISSQEKRKLTPQSFFPQPVALSRSSRAIHEYLGLIWARLRGQI